MKKKQLEDTQWLLMVSKQHLSYSEQKKKWNDLANAFRSQNKGLNKITDHLGALLSLTEGVYQD